MKEKFILPIIILSIGLAISISVSFASHKSSENTVIKQTRECILYSEYRPMSVEELKEAEYREFADCVRSFGGNGGGCEPP